MFISSAPVFSTQEAAPRLISPKRNFHHSPRCPPHGVPTFRVWRSSLCYSQVSPVSSGPIVFISPFLASSLRSSSTPTFQSLFYLHLFYGAMPYFSTLLISTTPAPILFTLETLSHFPDISCSVILSYLPVFKTCKVVMLVHSSWYVNASNL